MKTLTAEETLTEKMDKLRNDMKDGNCPTDDLKEGASDGNCFGDGHYRCQDCVHYRADFKRNGQDYIDFVHTYQNGITMTFSNLTITH